MIHLNEPAAYSAKNIIYVYILYNNNICLADCRPDCGPGGGPACERAQETLVHHGIRTGQALQV